MKAKIFGGADTLFNAKNGDTGIGARNSMLAEDMLNAEGIPIISTDIGGNCGRRIEFNTKTGIVKLRRFKSNLKL
ncbi:MAG: chemotaxis protein CheD [Thermodesulfovibrionales bacterium]